MYFITGITLSDSHCFGYYALLTEALDAVATNQCSMNESYYDYLVVEEIVEGIGSGSIAEYWYEWIHPKWTGCEKPKEYEGIINFAIG